MAVAGGLPDDARHPARLASQIRGPVGGITSWADAPDVHRHELRSHLSCCGSPGRTCGGVTGEFKASWLGHRIAASTVWQILHHAGIDPAPRRSGSTWREFLTAQARGIIAADFLHIDTALGQRLYALVFLEHHSRRLHIIGVIAHPTQVWTTQQARNLAADLGHRMESLRFLLRDRDGEYGQAFDAVSGRRSRRGHERAAGHRG